MNKIFYIFLLIFPAMLLAQERELRWAADAEGNAPFIFQDPKVPTNLIGFEVEIAEALAEEMGVRPVFVQNQWDGLIPGLYRGDYDIAINGLEITEDRKNVVNFSKPYYITYEQLVVRSEQEDIESLADLVGKKCGALENSLAERIIQAYGGIETLSYEGELNAFVDLENGRLDAVLVDAPIALYYIGWNPQLKLVGQPVGEVVYGIAVRNEDKSLLDSVNTALESLMESGKLREILERWNMWNYNMALFLGDKSPSNQPPVMYNEFMESQGKTVTFPQLIERYIGFLPLIGKAAWMTVKISVVSMLIAIFFGLFIALMRIYAPGPISWLALAFIEVMRGTPLLIQLFFVFYALPSIGIKLAPFTAAVLALGLNYAAYEAEIYRSGLFSIPRGQMESALALGMRRRQALRHVILPQTFRVVLPPVTNDFISLLKDSSLVSLITLVELTKLYYQLSAAYFDYIGTGILIAAVYMLLSLPFAKLSRWLEEKARRDKRSNV